MEDEREGEGRRGGVNEKGREDGVKTKKACINVYVCFFLH